MGKWQSNGYWATGDGWRSVQPLQRPSRGCFTDCFPPRPPPPKGSQRSSLQTCVQMLHVAPLLIRNMIGSPAARV
jgi:hypothetical protein